MAFSLRRATDGDLELTRQHDAIVAPRKGTIDWAAFDKTAYAPEVLEAAAAAWRARAWQELHSLTLFTQLASHVQLIGAPLDWSGAFARMIQDEVRHTDLCLRFCDALGHPGALEVDESTLNLAVGPQLRVHVRHVVVSAFCIGETISGRMFRQSLRAATVPLARDVVTAIVVDETFHGELGWELGALLMREIEPAERDVLAARLPFLFEHYARLCSASAGPTRANETHAAEVTSEAPNFGTLTDAGYARAFFEGMTEDVVPGLCAIGLAEARPAYEQLLERLDDQAK